MYAGVPTTALASTTALAARPAPAPEPTAPPPSVCNAAPAAPVAAAPAAGVPSARAEQPAEHVLADHPAASEHRRAASPAREQRDHVAARRARVEVLVGARDRLGRQPAFDQLEDRRVIQVHHTTSSVSSRSRCRP